MPPAFIPRGCAGIAPGSRIEVEVRVSVRFMAGRHGGEYRTQCPPGTNSCYAILGLPTRGASAGTLGRKRFMGFARRLINISIFAFLTCQSFCLAQTSTLTFPPFEQWKSAVLGGNVAALKGLYSQSPAAQLKTPAGTVDAATDIAFWVGLRSQKLQLDVVASISPRPGMAELQLRVEVHPPGQNVHYFSEEQLWQQQGGPWRLVAARRTRPTTLRLPVSVGNHVYPTTDARAEIRQALAEAAKKHKRDHRGFRR